MTYQPFPIADFGNGLFSAKEIWLAPNDAFSQLKNANIERGVVEKRPGFQTMGYFPERLSSVIGGISLASEAVVLASHINITAITQANPAVVTAPAHGFADGDTVILNDVVGMTEVNGNTYTVANKTANTFELSGTNSSAFTAYTYGGTVGYQHGLSANNVVIFQSVNGLTTGAQNKKLVIKSVDASANTFTVRNFDTSASTEPLDITGITQASPAVVTAVGHSFSNGNVVYISDVAGMTEVNGRLFTVANAAANTFELSTINSTGFTAYSSGGKAAQNGGTVDQLISLTYKAPIAATGITKPTVDTADRDAPVVITTSTAHGLATGNKVLISGDFQNAIDGMPGINNTVSTVYVHSDTTFTLENVNTFLYTAHTSGGDVFLVNSTANNKIMGIQELYQEEADNLLIVCSEDRVAKYSESLENLIAISTSDDWTGSDTQLFQMHNGANRLWMTNFKDGIKTTDGATISTVTFDILGDTGNDLTRARFVFPFGNRMCLLYTVEGGTSYPQRIRWSRIGYATGQSSEWDDTVGQDTTAGSLDAATDEEIIAFSLAGNGVVVFFERSIWAITETGSFDLPFRWQKLAEAPDIFNSPFAVSNHDKLTWALSHHGLVATDGIQVVEIDAVIPRWYESIDDGNYPIVFGSKLFQYDQNWTTYPDNGNEADRNDSVKVYNYKDKTFADYDFGYNCMGEYTIANGGSDLWSTIEVFKWLEIEDRSWGSFYAGRGSVDNIFGDDTGRIFRVDGGPNDDGAIISVTVESARLNPFKELGKAAQLGYCDFLFTRSGATNVEISFSIDFDDAPLMVQQVNLAPDAEFVDNAPTADKVWKRVYVNLVGNTHQIKITCHQQSSNFKLHAMVPYFRPQGRINMI